MNVIGIIGGGQLARMMCFSAHKLGFKTIIFSDTENSPASFVTNHTIIGKYNDKSKLRDLASKCDVITFEFENIPAESLNFLSKIICVRPSPEILYITQNRIREKNFLRNNNFPVVNFWVDDIQNIIKKNPIKKFILKTSEMGYDGKGQYVVEHDLEIDISDGSWILEEFTKFDKEISVIIARSESGEFSCYEPIENQHESGILNKSFYPANISNDTFKKAKNIAINIAEKFQLIGLIAIEFFVVGDEVLVNEIAPRPHNSGHLTMDFCYTSQFEQHIRAITGMVFGNNKFHTDGMMKNIIGDDIYKMNQYLSNSNAKIHLYCKNEPKIGRKMGHVNIVNSNE